MNNTGFGIQNFGLKKISLITVLTAMIILLMTAVSIYPIALEGDAYNSAINAYNNKDFDQAREEMNAFIKDFPNSKFVPEFLIKLGSIAEEKEKAADLYSSVIDKYAGSEYEAEAEYSLGQLYYAMDDYKKSKEYFAAILEKHRDSAWLEPSYYGMMLTLYGLKQYSEAESIYKDYKGNKTPEAFKNRISLAYANALFNQGNYQDSINMYKEVIKSGLEDQNIYMPFVYSKIVAASKENQDNKGAEAFIKELVEKYPDSKEARYYTANMEGPTPEEIMTPEPVETIVIQAMPKNGTYYTIQIGAYSNKKFADMIYGKMQGKKYVAFLKKHDKFYAVQIGKFVSQNDAKAYAWDFIKKEKLKAYLIKQETQ